jgi:hypothetical protein
MLNVNTANAPSPSIPLWPETVATPPRGEREAKPLSLDGGVALGQREVGERVFAKYSPYLIAGSVKKCSGNIFIKSFKALFFI